MLAAVFNGTKRGSKKQMTRRVVVGNWQDLLSPKANSCGERVDNEARSAVKEVEWVVNVMVTMVMQSRFRWILLTLDLLGGLVAAVKDGSLPLELEVAAEQVC